MSNSSDLSPVSSPDLRSEDIVLSARPSPGLPIDNPQSPRSPQRYLRNSSSVNYKGLRRKSQVVHIEVACCWGYSGCPTLMLSGAPPSKDGARDTRSSPRSTKADEASSLLKPTPPRSQPIAIELPTPRKVSSSATVYTPPAPLSARGDLPGGYFPLHEEQNRVYRPHPFQLDATKARMKSIQRASEESPPNTQSSGHPIPKEEIGPATTNVPPAKADRAMEIPHLYIDNLSRAKSPSASNTPVASYMPLGDQSSPLPMGKYYPSNYEKRKGEKKKKSKNHRPALSKPTMSTPVKSESQAPVYNQTSPMGHSRTESEAKHRLQQYQRDMIAQATIALNRGSANEAALSSIRSLGFSNVIKPSQPRLIPLGSPGPVTPMELGGSHDGYIDVRGEAIPQAELGRVTKSEEEQIRQEHNASPAIELGPSTL
ncbi:hypothetical protein F5Y12DRAFT_785712 [Xylaria sp. FL1777]|nr:hypothetical protein F5Y12DRAFT_785712 [Xylaria sp. FL1777]